MGRTRDFWLWALVPGSGRAYGSKRAGALGRRGVIFPQSENGSLTFRRRQPDDRCVCPFRRAYGEESPNSVGQCAG